MRKIKINKKAQQFQYLITVIIIMVVVALVIYGMVKLGIIDTLKNIIPGFGNASENPSSGNTGTGTGIVKVSELCDKIKNEIIISDKLKQILTADINGAEEIHVECGATDKSKPIIYVKSTKQANIFTRWDYVNEEMVVLSIEPPLEFQRILRTSADLENTLGIKSI